MNHKIIVIDDDPTGSQTVHGCLLITHWKPEVLEKGLDDLSPLFFVLSNTRSLEPDRAAEVTREICRNLRTILDRRHQTALFVSRSDSTLRGHYPVETDVIAEELGPFDAHFLVPAFFEAGRITRGGVHYIKENGRLLRTDATEYAHDSVFGYSSSYLPDYVQEKTRGRVRADDVVKIPVLSTVEEYLARIMPLEHNRCVAVDSEGYSDLRIFARALLAAVDAGKRLYLRSAASIVSALAGLPPQPVAPEEMWRLRRSNGPGAVIVGSHVQRSTAQLEALLHEPDTAAIEIEVSRLPVETPAVVRQVASAVSSANAAGRCAVIYTSRRERTFPIAAERLRFGQAVSNVVVEAVKSLPSSTSFLVCKGGITSNDILSRGLGADAYRVIGQIISGCTLVVNPPEHRLGNLPVVIFPGNVGGPLSLVEAYRLLSRGMKKEPA